MALDYLFGWTEQELLTELSNLQDEYMALERVTQTGAGDASASLQLQGIEERIALVKRSLWRLDSTTYEDWESEGETTTRAGFF